jgi:hypothetical protein
LMTINEVLTSGENNTTYDAGFFQGSPSVNLTKFVNGNDANTAPGTIILVNPAAPPTVTFTFTVTNTGNLTLNNVLVIDNILGFICTIPTLAPGASQTCTTTRPAQLGLHTNTGTVSGQPVTGDGSPFGPPY